MMPETPRVIAAAAPVAESNRHGRGFRESGESDASRRDPSHEVV